MFRRCSWLASLTKESDLFHKLGLATLNAQSSYSGLPVRHYFSSYDKLNSTRVSIGSYQYDPLEYTRINVASTSLEPRLSLFRERDPGWT